MLGATSGRKEETTSELEVASEIEVVKATSELNIGITSELDEETNGLEILETNSKLREGIIEVARITSELEVGVIIGLERLATTSLEEGITEGIEVSGRSNELEASVAMSELILEVSVVTTWLIVIGISVELNKSTSKLEVGTPT